MQILLGIEILHLVAGTASMVLQLITTIDLSNPRQAHIFFWNAICSHHLRLPTRICAFSTLPIFRLERRLRLSLAFTYLKFNIQYTYSIHWFRLGSFWSDLPPPLSGQVLFYWGVTSNVGIREIGAFLDFLTEFRSLIWRFESFRIGPPPPTRWAAWADIQTHENHETCFDMDKRGHVARSTFAHGKVGRSHNPPEKTPIRPSVHPPSPPRRPCGNLEIGKSRSREIQKSGNRGNPEIWEGGSPEIWEHGNLENRNPKKENNKWETSIWKYFLLEMFASSWLVGKKYLTLVWGHCRPVRQWAENVQDTCFTNFPWWSNDGDLPGLGLNDRLWQNISTTIEKYLNSISLHAKVKHAW